MNNLQIFKNQEFGEIRTVQLNNETYFVGKDVATALGYAKARNAIATHVSEEDKKDAPIQGDLGGTQQMTIINESGLYALIFGSKLESAKRFKHWVTSEVLPSIRKTGGYQIPQTTDGKIMLLAQGHVELKEEVDSIRADLETLKQDLPILPIEADKITEAVKRKGVNLMGGKHLNAYCNRSIRQKVYNALYTNLKYNFAVKSYKSIKRSECDKAIEIINAYKLPFFLEQMIENENSQQCFDFQEKNDEKKN